MRESLLEIQNICEETPEYFHGETTINEILEMDKAINKILTIVTTLLNEEVH